MSKEHTYHATISWRAGEGKGTVDYKSYDRDHVLTVEGKPDLLLSSDPAFRGDGSRYNPEDLLVASLSSCHMLWFLHLCSVNGIVVKAYTDNPVGVMIEAADGAGKFKDVILRPNVTLAGFASTEKLEELQEKANKMCFIANSVNFPVHHQAEYQFPETV